ncbi:methyltransferase domain-containing protein [Rhodospirillaceae bacterium SYSU D60014]|uniref:methyltransferase domain-containing protein n=1 Tax=Virgifigura deserti TaxID=2268457 RepID=UPI000E663D35
MSDPMNLFDRRLVRRHRDRAAADLDSHDFLLRETAERLTDRLDDVTRKFPRALDLGCHGGELADAIGTRGGIRELVQCDLSPIMARRAADRRGGVPTAVVDEEFLPFAPASFDLVLSNLSLHWVNDLPGCLRQIRQILKPDGLFLGTMLGGATLAELRTALLEAELAETGGASPRISPFADLSDAGGLLQRAGFALPVIDTDVLTVTYPDPFRLMRDLRGMGETNAVRERSRHPTRRATLFRAAATYQERHADDDGRLPATFQIVYLTGWAPHESQQTALRPGSAQSRLADALDTTEIPAGAKTRPH